MDGRVPGRFSRLFLYGRALWNERRRALLERVCIKGGKSPLLKHDHMPDDVIVDGLNTWERAWLDTCEGQQFGIVERLCEQGLTVEILGKEHSVQTGYKILIVHAPDDLVVDYAKNLRKTLWMSHGRVRDFVALEEERMRDDVHVRGQCQVIHHIIKQGAGLSEQKDPYVKMMFAAQDKRMNKRLARSGFAPSCAGTHRGDSSSQSGSRLKNRVPLCVRGVLQPGPLCTLHLWNGHLYHELLYQHDHLHAHLAVLQHHRVGRVGLWVSQSVEAPQRAAVEWGDTSTGP